MSKPLPTNCMTIDEVAEYFGVVPMTVRRLIKADKLGAFHIGRRVAITPAALEMYVKANSTAKAVTP